MLTQNMTMIEDTTPTPEDINRQVYELYLHYNQNLYVH